MKKNILLYFIGILGLFPATAQTEIQISVTGTVANTDFKKIELVRIENGNATNLMDSELSKNGSFKFIGKLPSADYYYVRLNSQLIPLVLRNNSEIKTSSRGNFKIIYKSI